MGKCLYCGKNAGIFRDKHAKCGDEHQQGLSDMARLTIDSILRNDYENLMDGLDNIARRSYVASDDIPKIMAAGWSSAIDRCLENSQISHEHTAILDRFRKYVFDAYSTDLLTTDAGDKFVLGIAIRDVSEGVRPSIPQETDLLFDFQRSETSIWAFNRVELWEERDELERIAVGAFVITTHSIYFVGGGHMTRIPYTSIAGVVPSRVYDRAEEFAHYEIEGREDKYEGKGAIQIAHGRGAVQVFVDLPEQLASSLIMLLVRNGGTLRDKGFIGITTVELDNDSEGLLVDEVDSGEPADVAGLMNGDVIQMLDDDFIRNQSDLTRFLTSRSPGETVRFTVLRDGKVVIGLMTLGARTQGK